jgi:L-asparagine oxygenase
MTMPLTVADTYALGFDETQQLWSFLDELTGERDLAELSADEFVELGATISRALPANALRAVHRFRVRGTPHDALLLRGLIPRGLDFQPTPMSLRPGSRGRATRTAEICLLGVMGLLGEPFTFASLYDGRIIQDVVPVPGEELAQTSGGSRSFLDWHVEDAFSADRCDYFGLLCLRADLHANTALSAVRQLRLRPDVLGVLREPRFAVEPDIAHNVVTTDRVPVPVITGGEKDFEICYDALYMRVFDDRDGQAAAALQHLASCVQEASVGHVLEPGDLLIVDNRRVVHARTAFTARYDGSDRWLLRTMVCASLPIHRRRGGARAIG